MIIRLFTKYKIFIIILTVLSVIIISIIYSILKPGDKKEIYDLARKSYLASKSDGDGGQYDVIYTEYLDLIDKKKRIRGFYDGTEPEAIENLMEDIEILKAE